MPGRRRAARISPDRLTLLTHATEPPTPIILGKGTFGTVYAGVLDSVHPIALKTTNPYPHLSTLPVTVQSAQDAHARHEAEAKRQLRREEHALSAAKRSPGVVRIFGSCHGGLVLQRLHQRDLPRDTIEKVRLCAEVATAVSGLHRLGITHGDIKLANVMFSNGVKLIDFGLSCIEGVSCEGVIGRGSGAYLAPEGWSSVQGIEQRKRVDVYALGMLIYEVFCGVPWQDCESVAVRVMNGERPEWTCDDDIARQIVEQSWQQDPVSRSSAELVAESLRKIERRIAGPIGPTLKMDNREKDDGAIQEESSWNTYVSGVKMEQPNVQVSPRSVNPFIVPVPAAAPVQEVLPPASPSLDSVGNDPQDVAGNAHQGQTSLETSVQDAVVEDEIVEVDSENVFSEGVPGGEQVVIVEDVQVVDNLEMDDMEMDDLEQMEQPQTLQPSSSGYSREQEVASSSTAAPTSSKSAPQQLDYPFKRQIDGNDLRSLTQILSNSQHNQHQATLVLEAITVLLVTPPNPELFSSSLPTLSSITSRNMSPRLAKTACLIVHRLATRPTAVTEKALRIYAAYDIVATALRRHPTEVPVVLTATTAIHALSSASTRQCAILIDQGAPAAALRSLARATRAFKKDLPIASAGMQALDVMSREHGSRLVAVGTVEAIMSAMGSFAHAQIDRLALPTLVSLCQEEEGKRRGVRSVGAVAGAISRATDPRILLQAYLLLAELAMDTVAASSAFSGSNVVEAVLGSLEDNVDADEKIVQAGFACLTSMSRLGGDICGSLEILQVFDLVYNLVNSRPRHRRTALSAAIFLEQIMSELRRATHTTNTDLAFSMLVQLQDRWPHDSIILAHCRNAIRMVREATGRGYQEEEEPKSSLRSLMKRFSNRKGNSLKVGSSVG